MLDREIIDYHGGRDAEVAALILTIQRVDVGLDVPIEEQPELRNIGHAYRDGAFWIALAGGEIVGTIGMMRYGISGVMKKLFVRHDHRGPHGASHALYDRAVDWAATQGLAAIFLDTPSIATRSHAFYRRKGFVVVERAELPNGYDFPDRDSLIFKLDLHRRSSRSPPALDTKESSLPLSAGQIAHALDTKTKPPGSLGRIEALAAQIARVQGSLTPRLETATLLLFAADHGIVAEGVSAYPQAVTRQMLLNFLDGGAASTVFARSVDARVQVVDAGVAGEPVVHPGLIAHRIAAGTRNSAVEAAMTQGEYEKALAVGRALATDAPGEAICLGEMGIGNTSAAALVAAKLTGRPVNDLVGPGTGVDAAGLRHKHAVLARAAERTQGLLPADVALCEYGGFEIVMMAGAAIGAAAAGRIVIVDGFIATAAALAATQLDPGSRDAMVFAHRSAEPGHSLLLDHLAAEPVLELGMRLGEGTGALLAWPLVKAAAAMLREMATFENAGVSGRN